MCFNRQHHVLLNSKLGRKLFVLPPRGSPQYLDPGSCLISNSISWGLALLSMFQLNLLWLLPWAHVRKPFPGEVFFQGLRCNILDSSLEVCFRLPGNVVGSSPWRSCLGAGLGTCAGNRGWAGGTQRALPASAILWFCDSSKCHLPKAIPHARQNQKFPRSFDRVQYLLKSAPLWLLAP